MSEEPLEQLLSQIRQTIHEANKRRITVRHRNRVIMDIPLSAGIFGALLAPGLAAVAVFGAIATDCKMTIE